MDINDRDCWTKGYKSCSESKCLEEKEKWTCIDCSELSQRECIDSYVCHWNYYKKECEQSNCYDPSRSESELSCGKSHCYNPSECKYCCAGVCQNEPCEGCGIVPAINDPTSCLFYGGDCFTTNSCPGKIVWVDMLLGNRVHGCINDDVNINKNKGHWYRLLGALGENVNITFHSRACNLVLYIWNISNCHDLFNNIYVKCPY